MKPADSNADQRAAEERQAKHTSAYRLRTAAADMMVGDRVEVPAELLTSEERQQVWAIFTHAAMRLEEESRPPGVVL